MLRTCSQPWSSKVAKSPALATYHKAQEENLYASSTSASTSTHSLDERRPAMQAASYGQRVIAVEVDEELGSTSPAHGRLLYWYAGSDDFFHVGTEQGTGIGSPINEQPISR